jgi:hypothetical protein
MSEGFFGGGAAKSLSVFSEVTPEKFDKSRKSAIVGKHQMLEIMENNKNENKTSGLTLLIH